MSFRFSRLPMSTAAIFIFLFPHSVPAQQTRSAPPPLGDPGVYLMFLSHQQSVSRSFARVNRQDQKAVQRWLGAMYPGVGITPGEFDALTQLSRAILADVEQASRERRRYFSERIRNRLPMEPDTVRRLEEKRQQTILAGWAKVRTVMSPQVWTNLQHFVDNDFRNRFRRSGPAS